jgi:hypothetical protein
MFLSTPQTSPTLFSGHHLKLEYIVPVFMNKKQIGFCTNFKENERKKNIIQILFRGNFVPEQKASTLGNN